MSSKGIIGAGLVVLCLVIPAQAVSFSIEQSGGGTPSNSWFLPSVSFSGPTYDTLEMFIINDAGAGPFESPGISYNVPAGWTGNLIHPGYILSSGPLTGSVNFGWFFDGNISSSVEVDVLAYNSGVLLGGLKAVLNNGVLGAAPISDPTGQSYDRTPTIPEPATATMGLLSVAGLMMRRRRMA